ncbi:hypothetical protein M9H77_23584 [Catharanthus roseus]|uniref:Uncharacterized protein n=1 Tax=Catharanthus roseus TaxID=4058 RepID=A0ACC0AXS6_CATRO|nr:hypothetical protein M9H77_23584 [Catharanthus roseus]
MERQLFQEKWERYPVKIREQIDQYKKNLLITLFWKINFFGLPPYTRKIGLPESRVLYTVLRSPHTDKKSREQFEMEIKKQFLVIKTERHELRHSRSDKGKLQRLFRSKIICLDPFLNQNRGRVKEKGDDNIPSMGTFCTFPHPPSLALFQKISPALLPKELLSDKEGKKLMIVWKN